MTTTSTSGRNFVPMTNKYDRVVLLVDMDCFYCQVEEKLDPSLKNQPLAVVQYNAWRGGGIIAVNYAARAKGVTRHMRGDEAKEQCPEIQLVKVPNVREKADLSKYREAGKEVANVLQRFTPLLERASVDEAYLDITAAVNKRLQEMNDGTFILQPQELVNTYAVGFQTIGDFVTTITTSFITNPLADDDKFYRNYNENDIPALRQSDIRLLIGASIASEIRSAVKAETSYECSAGIAHNKILAKLACGINKPNKQTILPLAQIPDLFEILPVGKIKGLGGKFGEDVCERLNVRYLGQILKFTEVDLQRKFDEKNGIWLYNICRGIDLEAVTPRFYSKSIGCCKKFPGRNNITGLKTLQHWLNELANEINERLEKDIFENNRRAKQMVVNFIQEFNGEELSSSRSAPLQCYDTEILSKTSLEIIKANTKQFFRSGSESVLNNPIRFLGISVGKFETISNSQNNIQEMFAQQTAKQQKNLDDFKNETQSSSSSNSILVKSQTISGPNGEVESFKTVLKQVPKEKQSLNMKSFFLNALMKEKHNVNVTSSAKNMSSNNIVQSKTNSNDSDFGASIQINTETISSDELVTSNDDTCDHNNKQIYQKSFFAKILSKKEVVVIKKPGSDLTLQSYFDNNNSNQNQNPNRNGRSCSELNNLITEKNTFQNEEYENNLEVQNENFTLSNNIIETDPQMVSKSIVKTANVLRLNEIPINMKRKYNKISDTEELTQKDYRSQYAEFAVPDFTSESLKLINCSKCGAKFLDDPLSIQTHEDHHYAQELSQQQRDEFRDEFQSKINLSKSPPNNVSNKKSKKGKILKISARKTYSPDIIKFLKPSLRSEVPESSTCITEICDICKLPIKIEELLEHKDFHVAKDLQRKLNQLEVHTVEVVKKTPSDLSRKSINSSVNMSSRHGKITAKPITQFFTHSDT